MICTLLPFSILFQQACISHPDALTRQIRSIHSRSYFHQFPNRARPRFKSETNSEDEINVKVGLFNTTHEAEVVHRSFPPY